MVEKTNYNGHCFDVPHTGYTQFCLDAGLSPMNACPHWVHFHSTMCFSNKFDNNYVLSRPLK